MLWVPTKQGNGGSSTSLSRVTWLTYTLKRLVSRANLQKGWKQIFHRRRCPYVSTANTYILFASTSRFLLQISCFPAPLCTKSGILRCFRISRNQFQFIEVANMMQDDQAWISFGCDMWDLGCETLVSVDILRCLIWIFGIIINCLDVIGLWGLSWVSQSNTWATCRAQVTMVKLMPTILKYLLSAEKTRSMKFDKLKWVRSSDHRTMT